ncbi:hypothetical protein HDU93_008085, partial [Gonapodya sp. JEL0774]
MRPRVPLPAIRSKAACDKVAAMSLAKIKSVGLGSKYGMTDVKLLKEAYTEDSVAYFHGHWKNLGRLPRSAIEFWKTLHLLLEIGDHNLITFRKSRLIVYNNGTCFQTSRHIIAPKGFPTWEGDFLIRTKFDHQGKVYDSAVFAERMADLDVLTGHLLEQPGVEEALLKHGIQLRDVHFKTLL